MLKFPLVPRFAAIAALAALTACASPPALPPSAVPIRFLLTFDDGPAPSTARVLDALADNPVQRGIKAIFFVQTRAPDAGGSEQGRDLMRRSHREGHLLGVHTGTPQGHVSHLALSAGELEASLADARADIAAVAGVAPRFVRPPFYFYDDATLKLYAQAGLGMLLPDVNPRDGTLLGINLVPARRMLVRAHLERIKQELADGLLPVLDGAAPVVVIYHDVNTATAANLPEHLQMLVEEARALGITLAERPFYDQREELERAAGERARRL